MELLDTGRLGAASEQVVHGGRVVGLGDAIEVGKEVLRAVEQVEGLVLLLERRLDSGVIVDGLKIKGLILIQFDQ